MTRNKMEGNVNIQSHGPDIFGLIICFFLRFLFVLTFLKNFKMTTYFRPLIIFLILDDGTYIGVVRKTLKHIRNSVK